LDYSLVSTKILCQKFSLVVRSQGLITLAKKAWNLPHLWHHPQETRNPKLCDF